MIIPELGVAPLEDSGTDLELAQALLELGVLPAMVTPIVDPEVGTTVTPAGYPMPLIPVLSVVDSVPLVVASPARPVGGAQFGMSPCCARYRLLAPCLSRSRLRSRHFYSGCCWTAIWFGPNGSVLAVECFVASGESTDSPLLPAPLTPHRIIEELVSGSVVASPTGDMSVWWPNRECRTYLGRAPLTFTRTVRRLVPLHGCWIVCGAVSTA